MVVIMTTNLSGGGEENAKAGESHKGGRDAYQAGQRFLMEFLLINIVISSS